jgi:hypothetical protein
MASTELSRKELTALQKRARRLWQDVTLHLQCVIGEHHPPETVTQFREGVQVMHKIAVTVANEKALAAYEAVRKSKLTKMRNKLESSDESQEDSQREDSRREFRDYENYRNAYATNWPVPVPVAIQEPEAWPETAHDLVDKSKQAVWLPVHTLLIADRRNKALFTAIGAENKCKCATTYGFLQGNDPKHRVIQIQQGGTVYATSLDVRHELACQTHTVLSVAAWKVQVCVDGEVYFEGHPSEFGPEYENIFVGEQQQKSEWATLRECVHFFRYLHRRWPAIRRLQQLHGAYSYVPVAHCDPAEDYKRCQHCRVVLMGKETSALCCANNTYSLAGERRDDPMTPQLYDNPQELEALLCMRGFGEHSRALNSMFALTSIGCKRSDAPQSRFVQPEGVGALRMNGLSYHRCLPAQREDGEQCGLTYWLYDSEYHKKLKSLPRVLDQNTVHKFKVWLRQNNKWVRTLEPLLQPESTELAVVLNIPVATQELAIYTSRGAGKAGDLRQIVFQHKSETQPTFVNCKHGLYETLQYPLLHVTGQKTWYAGLRVDGRDITLTTYTRAHMMQDFGDRRRRMGKLTEELLLDTYSRVLEDRSTYWRGETVQTRIGNVKTLMNQSRGTTGPRGTLMPAMERGTPEYQKKMVEDGMHVVTKVGPPTYFITFTFNDKWPEVTRHTLPGHKPDPVLICRVFRQKIDELLERIKKWDGGMEYYFAVVEFQHRGFPHIHIALRCLKAPSLSHMNAVIGDELSNDCVICVGDSMRAMTEPTQVHTTMHPDYGSIINGPDSPHIQTCMPRDPTVEGHKVLDGSTGEPVNKHYRDLLLQHMIHACTRKFGKPATRAHECRKEKGTSKTIDYCRKGYPFDYAKCALLTDTGYPMYARHKLDAVQDASVIQLIQTMLDAKCFPPEITCVDHVVQRVVPHCRELLETLEAHVNVEWAHSVTIIRYLYKYLYKNETTAKIAVSDLQSIDRIQEFLNAQRVSAVEAAWHLLGFTINRRSCTVEVCQVHVPDNRWVQLPHREIIEDPQLFSEFIDGMKMSMQEKYMNRPRNCNPHSAVGEFNFDALTLAEYFEMFVVAPLKTVKGNFVLDEAEGGQQNGVKKRMNPTEPEWLRVAEGRGHEPREHPRILVRFASRSPGQGCIFYLKQLFSTPSWDCIRCTSKVQAGERDIADGCAHEMECFAVGNKVRRPMQPRNYEQLRTGPTGYSHVTFQAAAHDLYCHSGHDEYTFMFLENLKQQRTPEQLEQLFIVCLLADGPFDAAMIWSAHGDAICAHHYRALRQRYAQEHPGHTSFDAGPVTAMEAREKGLEKIDAHLSATGKTLADFELPNVAGCVGVLERHKLEHPNISYTGEAAQALKPLKVWDPDAKTYTNKEVGGMTTEQKPIFDAITAHLFDETRSHQTKKQFVVTARSGRGKTWLMRLIVAKARSEGKVALCVASTALAALNYDGGRTAHSQFKIPVSDEGHEKNKEVVCALDTESSQADFLRAVDIIIWDEALNSHCVDIEAVDTMLRDLMGSSEPFGNKLVIFTGASLRHGMCGYIV